MYEEKWTAYPDRIVKRASIHKTGKKGYAMNKNSTKASAGPESFEDALTALLREGVQKLLMQAVEEEVKLLKLPRQNTYVIYWK